MKTRLKLIAMMACAMFIAVFIGTKPAFAAGADDFVYKVKGSATQVPIIGTTFQVTYTDGTGTKKTVPGTYGMVINDLGGGPDDIHEIRVSGNYNGIKTRNWTGLGAFTYYNVVDVAQWGTTKWTALDSAFDYQENLTDFTATDNPDLSLIGSNPNGLSLMFNNTPFNGYIGDWDVSKVTNMKKMFEAAKEFNQPLNDWDVSNVTDMSYMFFYAGKFNQPLDKWNVSKVRTMEGMFSSAEKFNQPLESWDVSSVEFMDSLFVYAYEFDQPLGKWDVSKLRSGFSILEFTNLSVKNYDETLKGWSSSLVEREGYIEAYGLYYSKYGETFRNDIIDPAKAKWEVLGDKLTDSKIKIIQKDKDTGEKLSGAVFEIINNKNVVVDTVTTDINGEACSYVLKPGDYTIKEKTAPTGYILDSTSIPVSATVLEGSSIVEKEILNTRVMGTIKITTVDSVSGGKLSGAVYEVKNDIGIVVATITSDANGEATSSLPSGNYTIIPKTAPTSYDLNVSSVPVTIATNGETVAKIITNVKTTSGGGATGGGSISIQYEIKGSSNIGGHISPSGTIKVDKGSDKTIEIKPDLGYEIAELKVDGKVVDITNSYTLKNIQKNHTMEVIFKKTAIGETGDLGLITEDHFAYMTGYPEHDFKPERELSRAEVATIFANLVRSPEASPNLNFKDTSNNEWYAGKVTKVVNLGLMVGDPDGKFRPNDKITRGEFAVMATKFDKLKAEEQKSFNDVDRHWAKSYILKAANRGWMTGYPDGSYKPDRGITRAEAVTTINNMLERSADKAYVDGGKGIRSYTDLNDKHWAYYGIMEASHSHDYTKDGQNETWTNIRSAFVNQPLTN